MFQLFAHTADPLRKQVDGTMKGSSARFINHRFVSEHFRASAGVDLFHALWF